MGEKLEVWIDHDRCVGSRICVQTVPTVFALDENGQAIVTNPEGDTPERILYAESQCPLEAIKVKKLK